VTDLDTPDDVGHEAESLSDLETREGASLLRFLLYNPYDDLQDDSLDANGTTSPHDSNFTAWIRPGLRGSIFGDAFPQTGIRTWHGNPHSQAGNTNTSDDEALLRVKQDLQDAMTQQTALLRDLGLERNDANLLPEDADNTRIRSTVEQSDE
jgi:hypothetical protein